MHACVCVCMFMWRVHVWCVCVHICAHEFILSRFVMLVSPFLIMYPVQVAPKVSTSHYTMAVIMYMRVSEEGKEGKGREGRRGEGGGGGEGEEKGRKDGKGGKCTCSLHPRLSRP